MPDGAPLAEHERLAFAGLAWANYSGPGELTVIEYVTMREYMTELAEGMLK
jgi:hypothetical protein